MSESEVKPDGFDNFLYSISQKQKLEENLFALSMKQMQLDQQNDNKLIAKVKKYTDKGLDQYTHK